jgi:hypothetical protein
MRLAMLTGLALISLGSRSGAAQATQCASAPVPAQDACYTTVDLFQYVAPQLGIALTGGNVILSQGGPNGGFPRFTVGVRGSVVAGNFPELQTPSATGPAFRNSTNPYPTKDQYIGLPAADASIGLFRGFNVGPVTVGGLDALVSASYVPTIDFSGTAGDISIEPESPLKIGYGGRLGLIEEGLWMPGLAVNYMLRDLPTTSILATIGGSDSLTVTDFALKTTSWRVTLGKSFTGLVLAVGAGQDEYDTSTGLEAIVNRPAPVGRVTTGPITASQKLSRRNYFANVALNFLVVKIVGEAGLISGGDVNTSNFFDIAADVQRTYGSVGVRIGY